MARRKIDLDEAYLLRKNSDYQRTYVGSSFFVKKKTLKKGRKLSAKNQIQQNRVKNQAIDRARKAKPPGKRISKRGKVYYERRANRSDVLAGYDKPDPKRREQRRLTKTAYLITYGQETSNGKPYRSIGNRLFKSKAEAKKFVLKARKENPTQKFTKGVFAKNYRILKTKTTPANYKRQRKKLKRYGTKNSGLRYYEHDYYSQ